MESVATWKKTLKIVSVVCVVIYAIFAVLGIAVMASLTDPEPILETLGVAGLMQGVEASLFATIAGAVIFVVYAFQLLASIAVLRGVKDPSKMKLGMVLYGIISVFTGISFAMSFASGEDSAMLTFTPFFVAVVVFYGSVVVHRSAK